MNCYEAQLDHVRLTLRKWSVVFLGVLCMLHIISKQRFKKYTDREIARTEKEIAKLEGRE